MESKGSQAMTFKDLMNLLCSEENKGRCAYVTMVQKT